MRLVAYNSFKEGVPISSALTCRRRTGWCGGADGVCMDGFSVTDLSLFLAGAFAAALVTGLAGFAFAIVAAAAWVHFLPPTQATALIVAYGLIVQGVSVWKLR